MLRIIVNRGRTLTLIVAVALAHAACATPAEPERARPYRYALPTDQVVRWPTGSAIRVWVDAGGGRRAGLLAQVFAAAAARWNRAASRREYRLTRVGRAADAEVVLSWSDAAWPVDDAGCPAWREGSAVTAFCASGREPGRLRTFPAAAGSDPGPRAASMLVVVAADLARDRTRLDRVVAHELGHVLGIGAHSPDRADLMWGGRLRTGTPSPADRATVRALYRARADLRP